MKRIIKFCLIFVVCFVAIVNILSGYRNRWRPLAGLDESGLCRIGRKKIGKKDAMF